MTITMYDAVDLSQFPANPEAVAGYVGGFWPTWSSLVARFPRAKHKSIAISAVEDADILDIENGDATPSQAADWIKRQLGRGVKRPGVYADAFTMPTVLKMLAQAGIPRSSFVVWVAHFTGIAPTPPFEQGADAVQYTDKALGRNLDASVCQPSFWDVPSPQPAKNTTHYERFISGSFPSKWGKLNERKIVQQYDGARKHNVLYKLYLKFTLQPKCKFLAKRVADEAINQDPLVNGKPSWGKFYRGWRYQQLIHRANGQRFV